MHDLDVLTQGSQNTIKGKIGAEWACESYKNQTPLWEGGKHNWNTVSLMQVVNERPFSQARWWRILTQQAVIDV